MKNYYEILGISKQATDDEIKKAFRSNAKKHHPDKFATATDAEKAAAEEKFKEVQEAYDILSDKNKRSIYDAGGDPNNQQSGFSGNPFEGFAQGGFGGGFGSGFGGFGFEDMFQSFAGGGFGGTPRQNPNIKIKLSGLKITDVCKGYTKELEIDVKRPCSACDGTGLGEGGSIITCPNCNGQGKTQKVFNGYMHVTTTCENCHGSGKIIEKPCSKCNGTKLETIKQKIKLEIPKGAGPGYEIKINNLGHQYEKDGTIGDVTFVIDVSPLDDIFTLQDYDVKVKVPIDIITAAIGGKIKIATPYGVVEHKLKGGANSGTKIRIQDRGLMMKNGRRGVLIAELFIAIPTQLTDEEKTKVAQLKDCIASMRHASIEEYNKKISE